MDLRARVLSEFRPANAGSLHVTLHEQWLATVQTASVTEYRRKFIKIAAPLSDISESLLMGQFINGLREDIKVEVRLLNPLNLDHAMGLATRVEERNQVNGPKRSGSGITIASKVGSYSIFNQGSISNGLSLGYGENNGKAAQIGGT